MGIRRVTARPGAFTLAGAGVALAACGLATVLAASLVVQDRAVARAIAGLPPAQRAVEVTWVGVSMAPGDRWAALDRQVRVGTEPLGTQPPQGVMLYRETRLGNTIVRFGAVDGVSDVVQLASGRAPRPCRPGRCEVAAIGPSASSRTAPGLVTTGRGSLRADASAAFFAGAVLGDRLRIAEGVDRVSRLPELAYTFRTYGWIAPLRPGDVRAWDVDDFQARLERSRTILEARSPRFGLKAPTAALADAGAKSRIAGRRLLLVGGQAVVLLLAFVLLAATRLRRGARAASRRLESFGASGWQIRVAALTEAALVVLPATVVGWVLGAAAALALAEATGTPAGALVSRSVASSAGAAFALAIAAAGIVVFYLGSRARPIPIGGTELSVADVAGAGALVAVLVAFAVGGVDAESLASSRGTGLVLLLLPGLIAFAAAVVLARLLQPVLRVSERFAARRSLSLKLVLLSLARAPGTTTVAVVFVSVSVGLAVFATTYRSTLLRNDTDQAAFEVPLDYTVREAASNESGAKPLGPEYAARFGAVSVVRRAGEAPSLERRGVTLLGIPAAALPRLHWRDDFASLAPRALSERIGRSPVRLRGARIPTDAREFRLPVVVRGDPVHLSANIRAKHGGFLVVDLGEPLTRRRTFARARLPISARGGLLLGLVVEFPRAVADTAAHRATGTAPALDVFRIGMLELGRPLTAGASGIRPLAVDYRDWVGAQGTRPAGAVEDSLSVRYLLTQEVTFRLRQRQPTDGAPVPAIASSSLARAAGTNGVLRLYVGTASVNVRVVATARRFPSVSGDFVVADQSRLETALNAAVPGSALPDEAWVEGAPGLTQRLARAAPGPVRITSRRARESELRTDPLARGSLLVLAAAAVVALALSLGGLALTVAVDLRDEAGELFDLEAQGMGPAALRNQVRLRAGAVLLAGLVGGLVIGTALTLVVLKSLAVSANSTEPVPPLVLAPDWRTLAVGCGLFVVLTLVVVALLTRAAFRGQGAMRTAEVA